MEADLVKTKDAPMQFFQSNILLLAKSVNCICPFCKTLYQSNHHLEFRQHCRLSICRICRIVCQILITESEANPNYNLMMRREACLEPSYVQFCPVLWTNLRNMTPQWKDDPGCPKVSEDQEKKTNCVPSVNFNCPHLPLAPGCGKDEDMRLCSPRL